MFKDCNSINELKKAYRKMALKHHPDRATGDTKSFVRVNEAYEKRFKEIEKGMDTKEANKINLDDKYREVINQIINLPDLEIELVGSWIWVSGNTYAVKDELKEAGFYWASKKRKWYWRPEEAKCKYSKGKKMDEIRDKYGSERIEAATFKSIAGS